MKGYWANLRPLEKRLVMGVAALFFVVLNWLFVFPYFSEWSKVDDRMFQAQRKLRLYESTMGETNKWWRAVRELEQEGLEVPPEDQTRHFNNTINIQEGASGVSPMAGGRVTFTTNRFFIELSTTIQVQSPEPPLVDFLYNLGSSNSLIRVRDLTLRPDPAHQQLVAHITLVASYQKKVSSKPGAPTTPTPSARTKLAAAEGVNK